MSLLVDRRLAGLTTALDVQAIHGRLRRALREHDEAAQLLKVGILDVQYWPGQKCYVLYRLRIRRTSTSRSARQLWWAELLHPGQRPPTIDEGLLRRYGESNHHAPLTTPQIYLPDVQMVFYAFPLDPALPQLLEALDPQIVRTHLKQFWASRQVRVLKVTARLVGYTPQARAAVHYEILSEMRKTGVPEVRRLVGKMHVYKSPARLFATAWALWRAAKGRIPLAPPVGCVPSLNLTLQEEVRGQRLTDLAGARTFVKPVRKAARAIAQFHQLSLPMVVKRTPRDEAEVVHRWAAVVEAIRPDLASRIRRLRQQLASQLEARVQVIRPVHADFHPANVLVDGDEITLIDLDEMAYGDPLVDVGRFMASLRVSSLHRFGTPSRLDDVAETFLDEYLAHAPDDERRARLFEAGSLLTAAAAPFRLQREGFTQAASLLLEEAERRFRQAQRGEVLGVNGEAARQPLSFQERVRWAQDGVYLQTLLDQAIRGIYGVKLEDCQVRGLKETNRSVRIRYKLVGYQAGKKWRGSVDGILFRARTGRGLFRRLHDLHDVLSQVPEALGIPRPIVHLPELSMVVIEPLAGHSLASLLGTRDATDVVEKLAGGLARLHALPVDTGSVRQLESEWHALREQVERLPVDGGDLQGRARRIMTAIEAHTRMTADLAGPVVGSLSPHHIVRVGEHVGIADIERIGYAHPWLDVGTVLAQLTLLGIKQEQNEAATQVAATFRRAYQAAASLRHHDLADLAPFEAAALLRLACTQVERDPQGAAGGELVRCAETCVRRS
jgi:aminoglycoside phosphotransferase (APT) family kinase protein